MSPFQRNYKIRLDRLYKFYHKIVFNLCMKYCYDEQIARDLTHDIFIKINKNLPNFRGESKYRTWIHRITVNYCLDYLRNLKRRTLLLEQPKNYLWELEFNSGAETENQAIASKELDKIPTVLKKILHMKYIQGLTQSEIATQLGISRVAVSKRLQNHARRQRRINDSL